MFGTVSSDDHYTGHKAAAFGGTTTVIDFVSQDTPTLKESVDIWHAKADPKAAIDFSFHMNITHLDDRIAAEIPHLPELGITSLKVFTAYNQRLRLSGRRDLPGFTNRRRARFADDVTRRKRRCDRYPGARSAGSRTYQPGMARLYPPRLGRG